MFRPSANTSAEFELAERTRPLANNLVDNEDLSPTSSDPLNVDDALAAKVPHFLDYDAQPPTDLEQQFERALNLTCKDDGNGESDGENLKLDKRYERDGEVSDFELAANGYTKKEFTQDDNTLHLTRIGNAPMPGLLGKNEQHLSKPKHFLDENPIPPDYMLLDHEREMREHRSLDRNFGRQHEPELQQRTESPMSLRSERKTSLDGESSHASRDRERIKQPSYALTRFLESCAENAPNQSQSGPSSLPLVYPKRAPHHSNPSTLPNQQHVPKGAAWTADAFSLTSSSLKSPSSSRSVHEDARLMADNLGPKVECVYSLLSMLGSNDPLEMAKKFLELSRSPGTCAALRRSGCIPLLVQMIYADTNPENVTKMASMALHNVVHSHPDEKAGRREAKVLRLLDQIIDYCAFLKTLLQSGGEAIADDSERHPLAAVSSLMKVSFDEEHRHAMCELGALQAIPNLVHLDHAVHGPRPDDQCCNSLRRYALMALTNLTFGDENNKALLCSQKLFMEALVSQLDAAPDDLLQVTASVLRNLSWRADSNMKAVLNEIGTVTALTRAAMKNRNENTLKAILSALWNLSAHCSTNKAEFCAVDGALAFLCKMLTYEGPSKTLKIIENAGGILRNVSSHIAVREHYRQILREHNCLAILLQQLKSESLTVVSNSCGTLWNLSARCPEDQKFLWDNGAVPMLRSLIHSKHAMISEGSSSALKNLLNFRPSLQNQNTLDPIARSMGLKKLPSLNVRKQRALEKELGAKKHAETCDNLDASGSTAAAGGGNGKEHVMEKSFDSLLHVQRRYPLVDNVGAAAAHHQAPVSITAASAATKTLPNSRLTRSAMLTKSESRDSIFSAKSDMTSYEHSFMRSQSASDGKKIGSTYTDNETSDEVEQPIDYSVKYNESSSSSHPRGAVAGGISEAYQETDLDQPTDFSLRYAEHQIESDNDTKQGSSSAAAAVKSSLASKEHSKFEKSKAEGTALGLRNDGAGGDGGANNNTSGNNEILLILDDAVKCYQTEDTPYVISNAASVTDLRNLGRAPPDNEDNFKQPEGKKSGKASSAQQQAAAVASVPQHVVYGPSGTFTPEKPVNYCEEGTPGYFSRYDSLSSLEESPATGPAASTQSAKNNKKLNDSENQKSSKNVDSNIPINTPMAGAAAAAATSTAPSTNLNSAQETPLMFSRYSSMDSLVEEDVGPIDDKSSVVSDFSRLASGVISPSEIPDSPTQSMPQSPRRYSEAQTINLSAQEAAAQTSNTNSAVIEGKRPLRSVFEDNLNTFHVENTPAQFSTATSLSNLSIIDDESNSIPDSATKDKADKSPHHQHHAHLQAVSSVNNKARVSDVEDEDDGEIEVADNDDMLLANCINIGINSGLKTGRKQRKSQSKSGPSIDADAANSTMNADEPKQYFTEDTPALLSKVGSNSNLSAISICSLESKEENTFIMRSNRNPVEKSNRQSLNLSDDMSSNASDCGAVGNQSFDLLQQCIQDGMKKKTNVATKAPTHMAAPSAKNQAYGADFDPISMLRRGGNQLPSYLPVADEMNKYLVEDSPCNFSVMSELSNLTVGSSLVGPAIQLKAEGACAANNKNSNKQKGLTANASEGPKVQHEPAEQQNENLHDDSLSSLSIESEDDTNLLSQAIAAGCNRPRSNLGFATMSAQSGSGGGGGVVSKRSLSASQPIPINADKASKGLSFPKSSNGNESCSSIESSDSNDNQSKSLLELCIRTGMKKGQQGSSTGRPSGLGRRGKHGGAVGVSSEPNATTQSNPNLKHTDAVGNYLHQPKHAASAAMLPTSGGQQHQQQQHHQHHHQRERQRKDERLLMECIKTGISTKTNTGSGGDLNAASLPTPAAHTKEDPKNVQATSAAASETSYQAVVAVSSTAISSARNTAASDVGQQKIPHSPITDATSKSKEAISYNKRNSSSTGGDFIDAPENRVPLATTPTLAPARTRASKGVESHQGPENEYSISPNATGCSCNDEDVSTASLSDGQLVSKTASLDNTSSSSDGGGSNESFIIETGVSLMDQQNANVDSTLQAYDKHKDPDLMMKSVERLTMEFLTSAELLRTSSLNSSSSNNNVNDSQDKPRHRSDSASLSTTTTTNTCPNDVSFPSVSVSLPMVASMNYDDDGDDVHADDEQPTEADHREFHDFAEITPTNDEQPLTSMFGLMQHPQVEDFHKVPNNVLTTQPSSLETETPTLMEDSNSGSSGINFKLGGAVKAAAAIRKCYLFDESQANMTNSNIIAFEARALAENLYANGASSLGSLSASDKEGEANDDCLTFSLNSLDLDNVRPPSGMESLNISGCYQDITPRANSPQQMNTPQQARHLSSSYGYTPQSPISFGASPKFPRKSLPQGLVARRALGQLVGQLMGGSVESLNSSNLLDNIKPPSLMDELLDSMISVDSIQSELGECESLATTVSVTNYETASDAKTLAADNNDFDDNTVTLHSCMDTLPRDMSGHEFLDNEDGAGSGNSSNATPLQTDDCYSSAESTPRKSLTSSPCGGGVKRTLTPKQKRKISNDRFKTYTISGSEINLGDANDTQADDTMLSEQQKNLLAAEAQDEVLQIEIIEATSTNTRSSTAASNSSRRRRSSQERYKTQIISYKAVSMDSTEERQSGCSSLTSTDDCGSETLSSIRAMTKNFPYLNDNVSSAEALEQNSDTESCNGDINDAQDIAGIDEFEPEAQASPLKINNDSNLSGRPAETEAAEAQIKAVRGRKKPAYISPYSIQYQRNNNNNQAKNPVTAATTRLLSKKGSAVASARGNDKKTATTTSKPPSKSIKQEQSNGNSKRPSLDTETTHPPTLERQGTFVKDEPTVVNTNVPVVFEETGIEASNCEKPRSLESSPRRTSKLPTKRPPVKANTTLSATARYKWNAGKTTVPAAKNTTSPGKASPTKLPQMAKAQRSNSNSSIARPNNNITDTRIAALSTRVSVTTPPSRSNSNLNANPGAGLGNKVQQAQSRIAGIWKRVNEAKDKQQRQPCFTTTTTKANAPRNATNLKSQDTRSSSALNNGNVCRATTAGLGAQPQKLVRSSTFDATPEHRLHSSNQPKPPRLSSAPKASTRISSNFSKPPISSNNRK